MPKTLDLEQCTTLESVSATVYLRKSDINGPFMHVSLIFESRLAINPGLGGMTDVTFSIISQEQTQ